MQIFPINDFVIEKKYLKKSEIKDVSQTCLIIKLFLCENIILASKLFLSVIGLMIQRRVTTTTNLFLFQISLKRLLLHMIFYDCLKELP